MPKRRVVVVADRALPGHDDILSLAVEPRLSCLLLLLLLYACNPFPFLSCGCTRLIM